MTMATRPNLKRPGYTATGRQWQVIEALRSDGWVILDRGQANELALAVKRSANTLYNLAQRDQATPSDRGTMKAASEALDVVTRALGANPYSVAWPALGADTDE